MGPSVAIPDSRRAWARLAVTLAIATVGNVGMWAIIVILPAIQAEFGVDRSAASLPYAATMVGFALGNLVIGRWVDRFGIFPCMLGAALVLTASFGLAALSGSILILSAVQFLVGFASATCFGPLIADISHWFLRRRGLAVAVAASGNYLSGAIWPLLLSGVLATEGWRLAYLLLALAMFVLMVPLSWLLRPPPPATAASAAAVQGGAQVGQVSFTPGQLQVLLIVAGVACCMAMAMPQVHIVALCVDLGYGPAVGAEMLSLMLLGGVVSRLVSGVLADWLGGVITLLIGSVLQGIALFLFLPFDALVSLYIVSLVFGLSQGGIVPSYAVIVREYMPAREAGQRVGVVIMATILGMALGGWVSGWIYDLTGSYQMAFVNGIAWNVLNVTIMAFILVNARAGRRRALA